jgi:uncharacterized protein YdcH (DUF465 family)
LSNKTGKTLLGARAYDFASFGNFFKSVKQLKPKIDEVTKNTQIMKDTEEVMRLKKAGLFLKVKD